MLKAAGLCSDVLYKELYIHQKEIDGEHHMCTLLLNGMFLVSAPSMIMRRTLGHW